MRKVNSKIKRKLRNRKRLKLVNTNRYRVSVRKSLNNLSAQIVDDIKRKTLVSASSIEKDVKLKKLKKMEKSSFIGEILAKAILITLCGPQFGQCRSKFGHLT